MKPLVLFLGPKDAPQLREVQSHLHAAGAEAVVVDTRSRTLPLTWSLTGPSTVTVDGRERVPDAAYLYRLPPRQPALAALARGGAPTLGAFVGGTVAGNAARDLVTAVLMDIITRGGTVFNPPRMGSVLEHKPHQLLAAVAAGLRVPATIAAGDPARTDLGALPVSTTKVYKPVRGGAVASTRRDDDGPMFIQEQIRGDDIRVLLVGARVHAAYRITGLDTVDPRADPKWAVGAFALDRVGPDVLGTNTIAALESLATTLGLPLCGIDLKAGPDGLVFLEANGSPIWSEADARLNLQMSAAVARALVVDATR